MRSGSGLRLRSDINTADFAKGFKKMGCLCTPFLIFFFSVDNVDKM